MRLGSRCRTSTVSSPSCLAVFKVLWRVEGAVADLVAISSMRRSQIPPPPRASIEMIANAATWPFGNFGGQVRRYQSAGGEPLARLCGFRAWSRCHSYPPSACAWSRQGVAIGPLTLVGSDAHPARRAGQVLVRRAKAPTPRSGGIEADGKANLSADKLARRTNVPCDGARRLRAIQQASEFRRRDLRPHWTAIPVGAMIHPPK
jgi:hypothetical protein